MTTLRVNTNNDIKPPQGTNCMLFSLSYSAGDFLFLEAYKSWENTMSKTKNETPNWYKFYARDWLTSESVMSYDYYQKGIYIDLLNLSWINNGIPDDPKIILQMLRVDKRKWDKIATVLQQSFTKDGQRLYNSRQENERKMYTDKVAKLREASKKGVEARNQKVDQMDNQMVRDTRGGDIETDKDIDKEVKPPVSPKGDGSKSKSPKKWTFKNAMDIPVPLILNTTEFINAWGLWLKHLQEKKKLPKATSIETQLDKLVAMGIERATEAIKHSIANNYQGIYEENGNGKTNKPKPSINDQDFGGDL